MKIINWKYKKTLNLERIGKILIGIGILHIFGDDHIYCEGCLPGLSTDCHDNSWYLITGALFFIMLGGIIRGIDKYKKMDNEDDRKKF